VRFTFPRTLLLPLSNSDACAAPRGELPALL